MHFVFYACLFNEARIKFNNKKYIKCYRSMKTKSRIVIQKIHKPCDINFQCMLRAYVFFAVLNVAVLNVAVLQLY